MPYVLAEPQYAALRRIVMPTTPNGGGFAIDDWLSAERDLFPVPESKLIDRDGEFEARVSAPGFRTSDVALLIRDRQRTGEFVENKMPARSGVVLRPKVRVIAFVKQAVAVEPAASPIPRAPAFPCE
jgi:hypothetical protein